MTQPHGVPAQRLDDGLETTFSASSSREKQDGTGKETPENDIQILGWDGPNDPANPQNFTETRKWVIVGAAMLATLLFPVNGTSITVAAREIDAAFNISESPFPNSYWTVTSWSVGGAFGIVVGLPLMEDLGVRLGFLIFHAFFILMIVPQALAQNFATLVVTRFFSGGCVTLLANIVCSMIPDVWDSDRARSLPVGVYILCYLVGSTLGPPMFAGVMQHIGDWRWIFYIQLVVYGAMLPLFYFTIKETRGNVILRRRAKRLRKETGKQIYTQDELNGSSIFSTLSKALYRPFYLQATEPVLMASTLWSSFCVGTVYMFTQSVELIFTGVYGWESWYTGYVQIAVVIGEILGWVASLYGTHLYFKSTARNTETPGRPIPEARLYVSAFCSFAGMAAGMFVYAWTSYPSIPWIAPAIGLSMVGFGIQTVVSSLADYIEDCYAVSNHAGSAISGIAAGENIVAAFLPLATKSMYKTMGIQWASTLLGFVAIVLSFAPVMFIWKGRLFRERSPYMLSGGETLLTERKS